MSQQVIDLVAAANGLPPEYQKLSHLILQLRDSHSIRTDLMLANDFVGTMKVVGQQAADAGAGQSAENAFLALFYSAVILYVRATKTQSDNRRSFDFNKEYDADQKVKHKVLCDLRDEALAHYGPGGSYSGPAFQRDGVFIPYGPDSDSRVFTASHRLVIQPQLIADLDQMTHRALMLSDKRTQLLNQKVVDGINEAMVATPDVVHLFRDHVGNLSDFLGSEAASDVVMAGPRVGYRRGSAKY